MIGHKNIPYSQSSFSEVTLLSTEVQSYTIMLFPFSDQGPLQTFIHLYTQTSSDRKTDQKLLHFFMNIKHFTGNTLCQAEKEIEPGSLYFKTFTHTG